MKRVIDLHENWKLGQLPGHGRLGNADVAKLNQGEAPGEEAWLDIPMPRQVHEVLLGAGKIPNPIYPDNPEKIKWVAETDWVYRGEFDAPDTAGQPTFLHFKGLDTLADIYLNGEHIASHKDMYLPLRVDVTGELEKKNVLMIHFLSPWKWLEAHPMPPEWEGRFEHNRMLRKPHEDFNAFNGAKPYFTHIGVFGDVQLEVVDEAELDIVDLRTELSSNYDRAEARLTVLLGGDADGAEVRAKLVDPDGKTVAETSAPAETGEAELVMPVDKPRLWWPRFYGEQPLYSVEIELVKGGSVRDTWTKRTGFRRLQIGERLECKVNGVTVRHWGSNLTPPQLMTHRWDSEKWKTTFEHVLRANFTAIRIWGPGAPFGEEVFDDCDEHGILVWDEFYHTWGMYPDDEEYRALCRAEAEEHVLRRKHHPSIMFWCGGNEQEHGGWMDRPGERVIGEVIWEVDYREVCGRLDPDRYYHASSPMGGNYPNDPRIGDSHSYNHVWFQPGDTYPVAFTENTRISPPQAKTLKRVLGDDAWPQGFDGLVRKPGDVPVPKAWAKLLLGYEFLLTRLGRIEQFYDTTDTLEGLIDKLGAGHCEWIRRCVEAYRRGRPADDPFGPRRTMGHYLWKLNNTWPMVYSNLIDYFLELNMSYYALRRAYSPRLLSFEFPDRAILWAVNDTGERLEGHVVARMIDMKTGEKHGELERPVYLKPGQSAVVADLDEWNMFDRHYALHAELYDSNGNEVAETVDFAEIERRLRFPQAKLEIDRDGDALVLTSDKFARRVWLKGKDASGEDAFGWYFEDNYFDLVPGKPKRVRIFGPHGPGRVSAQARFSDDVAEVDFKA